MNFRNKNISKLFWHVQLKLCY